MASTAGVTYTYDGDGKRVKKSNGTLYWYGIHGQLLAESDASGNIVSEYIFFGGMRIARRDANGNVYYFLSDRLGNARVLTNSTGGVVEESDFYPFGVERPIVDTLDNNYKFTRHERDAESGLDHTHFRQYSCNTGRWLSPDSVRGRPLNPQSWNRYSYGQNNPSNTIDPDGAYGLIVCETYFDRNDEPYGGCYCLLCPAAYSTMDQMDRHFSELDELDESDRALGRLQKAFATAMSALGNADCKAIFGEGQDPAVVLSEMMANYTFGMWDISGRVFAGRGRIVLVGMEEDVEYHDIAKLAGATAATSPLGYDLDGLVNIKINLQATGQNAFQRGNSVVNGGTLLHELGHVMTFLGNTGVQILPDGQFDDDLGCFVPNANLHPNQQLIREKCLPGLPDLTPSP